MQRQKAGTPSGELRLKGSRYTHLAQTVFLSGFVKVLKIGKVEIMTNVATAIGDFLILCDIDEVGAEGTASCVARSIMFFRLEFL